MIHLEEICFPLAISVFFPKYFQLEYSQNLLGSKYDLTM